MQRDIVKNDGKDTQGEKLLQDLFFQRLRVPTDAVDGIGTGIADERQDEKIGQGQFCRIPELRKTDGHAVMSHDRLGPVRAEKSVPPGKIKTEITVCFANRHRMMDAVHVRGDNQQTENGVKPGWHADIAMIKHGRAV